MGYVEEDIIEFTGSFMVNNEVNDQGYSKLRKIRSGSGWLVTHNWVTPFGVVKAGFWSDGVSVPWLFRWYIHRNGALLPAAILHDNHYYYAINSKIFADSAFYSTARYYKVNRVKAYLAYLGVKFIGRGNYL